MLQIEIEKLPSYILGKKRGMQIAFERDFAIGVHKKALEIAKKLLERGWPLAEIAEITGLTMDELKPLQSENLRKD